MTEDNLKHIINAYFILQDVIEGSDVHPLSEEAYGNVLRAFNQLCAVVPKNIEDLKFGKSPLDAWQSICDGITEKDILEERRKIKQNLNALRKKIIPDYLESEVKQYKGNAASSSNPSEYLTNCIADWIDAAISNPDMTY